MKYENTFKAIDQILWKEQGFGSELDYLKVSCEDIGWRRKKKLETTKDEQLF